MNAKQNKLTAELLKLIQENPELPVVPMVAGEVVPNDEYGYWLGRWGKAKVDEYLPRMMPNERYFSRAKMMHIAFWKVAWG